MGFDGVDFRGLQDDIDITQLPAFTTDIATTKTKFADAGLHVCGISSSLKVCDDTKVDDNLEEAKRTIPVAAELGTETIRVFGGGDAQRHSHQQMADIGQQMMLQVLELEGGGKVQVGLRNARQLDPVDGLQTASRAGDGPGVWRPLGHGPHIPRRR